MPLEEPKQQFFARFDQQDVLAKSIRVGLSICGPVGALVGEFVAEFIPKQRMDRLRDFTEHLAERLKGLEDSFERRVHDSPAFSSLTEKVTLDAVRTASDDRRRDLAEVLKTGLLKDDAALVEHEALTELLAQINDAQVLILMSYGGFKNAHNNPEREAFIRQHSEVFDVHPPTYGDHDESRERRWTMYCHYKDKLAAAGLLSETQRATKSSSIRSFEITRLGRMLLEAIGQPNVY